MKGFYIFEESLNQLRKEATVACFKLGDISHIFNTKPEPNAMVSAEVEITASVGNTITKATTNEDDTYDFETGALIALMKMCGVDKVTKACDELYKDGKYKNALQETTDCLNDLSKRYDVVVKHCDSLREANKGLQEEVKRLKGESESHWKKYQRNIQKKQDRINQLEAQIKASEDDKLKNIEYYEKEIKNLKGNIDELFESEQHTKTELGRLYFEKHRLEEENEKLKDEVRLKKDAINEWKQTLRERNEKISDLVCENYKLKTDCEKLQHGYIDTDNVPSGHWDGDILDIVFLPGRACGKQYKALVELFKKIDQKKVDAAYKEAYNTELPAWKKEFLNQMYGIYKESREKAELPRTLDINGTTYKKEVSLKDLHRAFKIDNGFMITGWDPEKDFVSQIDKALGVCKPLTKREKMWEDIKNGKIDSVKVEKAFINDFLSEAEENGLVWANGGEKPTEWNKWESWRRRDYIVFSLLSVVNPKELTWNTTLKENTVDYLPPMRWDLFKKGRLAVKVNYDNYKEFYEACEREIGKKPMTVYTGEYTVGICKKDGLFQVFTVGHQKNTGKKIVNWEDVR